MRRKGQVLFGILAMLLLTSSWLPAQMESGSITGVVTDPQGAAVAGAEVTATNVGTGVVLTTRTNNDGTFTFSTLRPSHYRILIRKEGFKEALNPDIDLHVQDRLSVNMPLAVGSSAESVTVSASSADNIETSTAVTTTVDRHFVENMPLNGRSFQALIALTPGNVTAKTYYTNAGQFSVNGQRTDANYFSIDGVSANVGITQGSNVYLGAAGAGASQATSNNGGYNSMVSVDAMQEYKIQTSSFDPEYGRTPGAQLSIATRSGTNQIHGTVFEYVRNELFDANNWYNNDTGLPRPAEKQNDFGGVVGGPIWRDKLFFFFSYEGLRLRVPESRSDTVPSTAIRARADSVVAPLFDAYPLPSHLASLPGNDGPNATSAIFATTFSNPSVLDASSLRLDWAVNSKLNLFVRGNYAPSNGAQYGAFDFYTRSTLSHTIANVDTITAGATYVLTNALVDDFRFNLSHAKGATVVTPTNFGGATAPSNAYLFQSNPTYSVATSVFGLYLNDGSTDYYVGNDATNHQRQLNFVDTLSWSKGHHNLKFGADYRRLTPTNGYRPWDISYDVNSFADLLTHSIYDVAIDSTETSELRPIFYDLSFYAQDSWQLTPRLTMTYGVRWDYDPPPGEDSGHPFYTALDLNDPANVSLAPKGTALWHASKHNFAPRLGIAYVANNTPGRELVVRGAGGIFFGLGNQQGAQGTLGFPYSRSKYLYGADGYTYPATIAEAAPVPFTLDPPYSFVFAFEPDLRDPKVYQWNVSVEQQLGQSRALQLAYVGNVGADLLRRDLLEPAMGGNANFQYLDVVTNQDWSNYNSLQAQFKQRMWQHFQVLASYTWSHALDNGSGVGLPNPYYTVYSPELDRGNSDYDVRNTLSAALTYELQGTHTGNGLIKYASNGWAIDSLFRSNSGQPVNLSTGVINTFGLDWNNDAIDQRPNVVPGEPLYVTGAACRAANNGANCPGGRRFNPAHFATPTGPNALFEQGNLGRNQLRGFDAVQEDIALRRDFPIHENISVQFRAEAFNVLNHPMFGDVGTQSDGRNLLNNSLFGISAHSLADSLGSGGADGGFSSLYQIGSPRSMQFAVKLKF